MSEWIQSSKQPPVLRFILRFSTYWFLKMVPQKVINTNTIHKLREGGQSKEQQKHAQYKFTFTSLPLLLSSNHSSRTRLWGIVMDSTERAEMCVSLFIYFLFFFWFRLCTYLSISYASNKWRAPNTVRRPARFATSLDAIFIGHKETRRRNHGCGNVCEDKDVCEATWLLVVVLTQRYTTLCV